MYITRGTWRGVGRWEMDVGFVEMWVIGGADDWGGGWGMARWIVDRKIALYTRNSPTEIAPSTSL